MLTADQLRSAAPRRRSVPSLQLQFQEYLTSRIEAFKNSLSREELLRLGDEAFGEMETASEEQFVLTEMLMADVVDRLIAKRLQLPSYKKWRQQILAVRAAQRLPTHWGIDPAGPVGSLVPRLEPGDEVLIIGPGVESAAYLFAAVDVAVTFVHEDIGCVERVESRMASESLGTMFTAWVVQAGAWYAAFERPWAVVIVDLGALGEADTLARMTLLERLASVSAPACVHVLVPGGGLAPEAVRGCYAGWREDELIRNRRYGRSAGLALTKSENAAAEELEG